jgi:PAS domain-containing protein
MVTEFEPETTQSDKSDDDQMQLQNIIGLGKFSVRKSYYPELQKKIAELEEEKDKYERIFSGALNGIFQADLTGRMIVANPAMSKLCGYDWPHQPLSITDIGAELFVDPAEKNRLITTLLAENHDWL